MIRQKYKQYRNLQQQKDLNKPYQVQFYNFWKQETQDMWFYKFLKFRGLADIDKRVVFVSTFGNRNVVDKVKGDVNIFFSGENLKRSCFSVYSDHLLGNPCVDLAMGFEFFEDDRYFRFPLWLHYMFDPEASEQDIVRRCEELNHPVMGDRKKFACHVSSEDDKGCRKTMCQTLSQIAQVDCAGKVMHNCDDLWEVYGNDKHAFLTNYKFNLCPENSNCDGYVTEKLFQAIAAGCIPIYWGSYNAPEPNIVNEDAVLFWKVDGDNDQMMKTVELLNSDDKKYAEFFAQPRLKPSTAEYVISILDQLENRVRELINR